MGLAFERVCMFHVNQIKRKLGISGVLTEVNSWYCKADPEQGIFGSQIDLLIVRKDQVINLCEMKYANSEFTITDKEDKKLRNKVSDLKNVTKKLRNKVSDLKNVTGTRYAIYPTLITTYGLVNNSYALDIQAVIVLDDLFA